jgi:hypothetical protein
MHGIYKIWSEYFSVRNVSSLTLTFVSIKEYCKLEVLHYFPIHVDHYGVLNVYFQRLDLCNSLPFIKTLFLIGPTEQN